MQDKYIAIAIGLIGFWVINHYWHKNNVMSEKFERIKRALRIFSSRDQLWDESLLKKVTRETFEAFSEAMDTFKGDEFDEHEPRFNYQAIKHLLHPNATTEVKMGNRDRFIMRSILAQLKGQIKIRIIHARNSSLNDKDCFTACIDTVSITLFNFSRFRNWYSTHITVDKDHSKEFWTFQRSENKWLLLCIHDENNWEMFTEMRILDEGNLSKKSKAARTEDEP